jgi:hypothetical protein
VDVIGREGRVIRQQADALAGDVALLQEIVIAELDMHMDIDSTPRS